MVKPIYPSSLFGKRLREARLAAGIAQDKLGVMIGLDEGSSSARMSRYENGVHSPSFNTVEKIAEVLNLPASYFYCADDALAEISKIYFRASKEDRLSLIDLAKKLTVQA